MESDTSLLNYNNGMNKYLQYRVWCCNRLEKLSFTGADAAEFFPTVLVTMGDTDVIWRQNPPKSADYNVAGLAMESNQIWGLSTHAFIH